MSSVLGDEVSTSDLTAQARLRDAAIRVIAHEGLEGFTARRVAGEAGVSPGLIAHHFDSMDGLRHACDDHVAHEIRDRKSHAIAAGPAMDPLAVLQQDDTEELRRYLIAVLTDRSPALDALVDDLVADAEEWLAEGVAAGRVRPTSDPRARAALVMVRGLGQFVLHEHLRRLLGIDLADLGASDHTALTRFVAASVELDGHGVIAPTYADQLLDQITAREGTAP